MDIRSILIETLRSVMAEHGLNPPATFADEQPLLETGLDSLGYAVVVTRLELALGYDPFVLMEEAVYPRTFGELLAIYLRFRDRASGGASGSPA